MLSPSEQHRSARQVLHRLPPQLFGGGRRVCHENLFVQCSFGERFAISAEPDWAARRLGGRASARDADCRALQSRESQESRPRGNGYAARWTTHAEQSEVVGNRGIKLRRATNDCTSPTTSIR